MDCIHQCICDAFDAEHVHVVGEFFPVPEEELKQGPMVHTERLCEIGRWYDGHSVELHPQECRRRHRLLDFSKKWSIVIFQKSKY